ncbi:uncharacterized protein LOC129616520 [Condylostylus longicornis]|uniref:uncharacterized protein LOC129616520 n=1 Tax=Condylostylus longicornis TaxID=2530218 RepID=UPI00244DBD14|nr:uncharacterized protein LOC129616520 [Condylostylus longicornis]
MAEADIEKLKTQRASAKSSLTRIKNIVENKKESLSLPELECRLGILESYFKQLLSCQTSYETLMPNDNTNITYRSECEEVYISVKSLLTSLISNKKQDLGSQSTELNQSFILKSTQATNLHKIKLPRFDGKYSEYPNFIGIFNKSIHNNANYEIIEKCNILVSSLDGIAKNAVREFRISNENYPKILKHLNDRFNNKTLMFQELIGELFQLPKITRATATNLRNMVDSFNAILSSMLSIGSGENIANSMIIYVVMSKLDAESQNKWEETVDLSNLLSWQDCSKVLSKRCQFLKCKEVKQSSSLSTSKFRNKSISHNSTALSVSQSGARDSSSCPICNDNSHTIYKCKKISELPVITRFEKVKNLALCINCLNKGHSVKRCNSSKCRICSAPHHT